MAEDKKIIPLTYSLDAMTAQAVSFNLFHFYQMYNEIFNYNIHLTQLKNNISAVKCEPTNDTYHDPQVMNKCIRHFRTVYRRNLRGVAYLTPQSLRDTQTRAMNEAVEILKHSASMESIKISNEALFKLKEQLSLEEGWIATVNQQRRQAVFNEIKAEAMEIFKSKLPEELPLLVGNADESRLQFYPADVLSEKLERMKENCIVEFKDQIQFEEEQDVITAMTEGLSKYLTDHFFAALIEENKNRKESVVTQMKCLVRSSVSKFRTTLQAVASQQMLLDVEAIMQAQTDLHQEFTVKLDKFPDSKCKRDQLKNYDDRVKRITRDVVEAGNKAAQTELTDCLKESKEEISKLVEIKLKEILEKWRIPNAGDHADEVARAVKDSMEKTIGHLQAKNQDNLQTILSQIKTEDEKYREEMMRMLQVLCDKYETKLKHYMTHENTYWHVESESFHIRQFHQEMSKTMSDTLQQFREKNGLAEESVKESQSRFVKFADDHFRNETGLSPTKRLYEPRTRTSARWSCRSDIIVRKSDLSAVKCSLRSHTLVFQLSPGFIRMGMMVDGKPTLLENENNEKFTKTQVGLHVDGSFIYGKQLEDELEAWKQNQNRTDEIKSEITLLQENWDLYSSCPIEFSPWSETIKFQNKEMKITYEFLLSFLLRKLKNYAETKMGVTCTATVIAIPIWFTSSERVRVKDAAEMAGFSEVYLINQVAAAAFASVGVANKQGLDNVVVFSQHGTNSVDLTLYEVDKTPDTQEQVKFLHTETVKMAKSSEHDYEEALNDVRRTCSDMLFSYSRVKHGAKLAVAVNWEPNEESSMQTQVLKRVASEMIGKRVEFTEGNEIVVRGALMLAENLQEIGVRVRDKLNYDVIRHLERDITENSELKCVFPSTKLLPLNGQDTKIVSLLPKCMHKDVYFSQMVGKNGVGYAQVQSLLRHEKLEITLSINHEGIIEFDGIRKLYIFGNNPNSSSVDNDVRAQWYSPRLSKLEREEQKKLLEEAMNF